MRMKMLAISVGDRSFGTKLDVRDLGGRLDVTLRALAGTLSGRARKATFQVQLVCHVQVFSCWFAWR